MHELDSAVAEVTASLHFHRRKARNHFFGVLGLAVVVFIAALAFSGYMIQLLQTTAQSIALVNNHSATPLSPPNFTGLASEHGLGYAMVSGFVLALFIAAGLLRYHVKRATICEDRLYHLLKVSCLRSPNDGLPVAAQKSLLDLRENQHASSSDSEAHAGLAVVERTLQALGQSVGEISKRASKRNVL
jgi:hypothetical protein